MKITHLIILSILFFVGCSSYQPTTPVKITVSSNKVDFIRDVKPVLDKRCVTCHSCYNSPCQAKLSSYDGIDRGASKAKVYHAQRLFPQKPSRLFVDAKNTQEWRKESFFSLTENLSNESDEPGNSHSLNSIMAHLLENKNNHPEINGEYAPEYDALYCPQSLSELSKYLGGKKNHGMPYGFPALTTEEHNTMMQWLAQGAPGPSNTEQKELKQASEKAQKQIDKFEYFLNTDDAKHQLTARYLYEHYSFAHIHFHEAPDEFYTLVRSRTPPGEMIDIIATRRPYDDPGVEKFYYRFDKIHSTIVHKTHIVVELGDEKYQRIKALFIDTPWLEKPHRVSYDKKQSANPFLTYAQIPPDSRYQFLLDDSEYFVRTFIRGPVCKGQIALNVIHDQFWVMFQDPAYDLGVQDPQFLIEQSHNLSMPIEAGSSNSVFKVFSDKYRKRYSQYYYNKFDKTMEFAPAGWPIESIWKGRQSTDAPALTIYRHFDSASVHKGFIGELPRTAWVIDYALFERIYYTLVAGFDVYGNVSHQTNVRRYMDFLRIEGEIGFLSYMPKEKRAEIFSSWYIGDSIKNDVQNDAKFNDKIGNAIHFHTLTPKQELLEKLVDSHFLKETNIHFDKVNYFRIGEKVPPLPTVYKTEKDLEQGLRALTAPGTGFVRYATNHGLNVMHIRIRLNNGDTLMNTLVINRWHDNVNSLFGETSRLDSSKDTLDVIKGNVGSYPNIFIDVKEDDLPDFFNMLVNFQATESYMNKIKKYAISRSDNNFWYYYDWFQAQLFKEDPVEAGLYDLNRYYKKTL